MIKIVNGVEVEMTPEEVASWEAEQAAYVPTEPAEPPVSVQQIAAARLLVDGWDVTGVERSQGFSGAFMVNENVVWAFFSTPQEDNLYMVTPNVNVTKYEDYIEIDSTNLSDIRFVVQRVK